MSEDNEDSPRPKNLHEALFGPPPSPVERLDFAKKRLAKFRSALPHVEAARAALRELDMLGYSTAWTLKAKRALAKEHDALEGQLVWPVEP